MKRFLLYAIGLLALASCQAPQTLYSWYDSEDATYEYTKRLTEEKLEYAMKQYQKVIAKQKGFRKTVPPGVNAEYGFLPQLRPFQRPLRQGDGPGLRPGKALRRPPADPGPEHDPPDPFRRQDHRSAPRRAGYRRRPAAGGQGGLAQSRPPPQVGAPAQRAGHEYALPDVPLQHPQRVGP